MKSEIVIKALRNLRETTGIQGKLKKAARKFPHNIFDAQVDLIIQNQTQTWDVEVKNELRNYHLPPLFSLKTQYQNLLLVADSISPRLKEELRNQNIAYLDGAGNAFIKRDGHFIFIEGHKKTRSEKAFRNRAFTKAGLKVVFNLLIDETVINATYRKIAHEADIALGNVPHIIHGLKQLGYVLKIDRKRFKLVKKRELLQRWMVEYDEKLKPALYLGNYRFLKAESFRSWRAIQLKTLTQWGGEPAADILTDYLRPEILTIYTREKRTDLMKDYRLVPDDDGNIQVFKKFWCPEEEKSNVVPPLLVYTDLVNSGNPRNIETANLIDERYLKHLS